MTEQQVKKLKDLLDATDAPINSAELDSRIMRAASTQAEQRNRSHRDNKPFLGFMSSSLFTAAVLSLLMTAGVFIALSQIVNTGNQSNIAAQSKTAIEINFGSGAALKAHKPVSSDSTQVAVRLDELSPTPTDSSQTRDQILAQMSLPDGQDVLGGMEFLLEADRVLAEQSVQLAMSDIRTMIGQGQLKSARERYERLRQSCDVCSLPSTLEALVLNDGAISDSG